MIAILWAFLRRDLKHEMSYKLSFAMQLIGLLPMLLLFLLLSRFFGNAVASQLQAYGGRYFPFVLIGLAVQAYLGQGLGLFSSRLRDAQLTGTLEAELATPTPLPLHLAGMALYPFAVSTFQVFLVLGLGSVMGGVHFHWHRLPLVFLVLLLSAGAFTCLGILSASYIVVFKRGDPVGFVVRTASWILGGVYFPGTVLPARLQHLAALVPMTQCLEALRRLLLGDQGLTGVMEPMALLAPWVVVGLPLCYLLFRTSVLWAKRKGSLGQY